LIFYSILSMKSHEFCSFFRFNQFGSSISWSLNPKRSSRNSLNLGWKKRKSLGRMLKNKGENLPYLNKKSKSTPNPLQHVLYINPGNSSPNKHNSLQKCKIPTRNKTLILSWATVRSLDISTSFIRSCTCFQSIEMFCFWD